MDRLARRIERDLEERHFCVVFEDEVERCWPKEKLDQMEREEEIQAFAKSRGWNAFIHNSRGSYQGNILELVKGAISSDFWSGKLLRFVFPAAPLVTATRRRIAATESVSLCVRVKR